MIDLFQKMYALISPTQRRQLYGLGVAIIVMALIEVAGIVSLLPFLAVLSNPELITSNPQLAWAYTTFGFEEPNGFLIMLGAGVFAVIVFGNVFSAATSWWLHRFTWTINHSLSITLLKRYLFQPYVFFLNQNSAGLSSKIISEVAHVVSGVFVPLMHMVYRAVTILFIVALLFAVDPVLSISVALVLCSAYTFMYAVVRKRLTLLGTIYTNANQLRYQAAFDAFGGIKDVKILEKEDEFVAQYATSSKEYTDSLSTHQVISDVPRFALETIAIGGMLVLVLLLMVTRQNFEEVIPLIGLYAFAGFRLMPAVRLLFVAATALRMNSHSLALLYDAFENAPIAAQPRRKSTKLSFGDKLELANATFSYPSSSTKTVEGLTLTIHAKQSVAFVGSTGCGKTTTVDLILGLLSPQEGELIVDGISVNASNHRDWQANIGYVPQNIYLRDASVSQNIAFGVPAQEIDHAAVERAARIANIHEFVVSELPQGYATEVGERGVRLSGGQRQRLGIARALYRDPELLVLDEATSALDGVTENAVMEAITQLTRHKTIIMIAHRLSTIKNCDIIFMMEHGKLVAQGSYEELIASNQEFHRMAKAAGM